MKRILSLIAATVVISQILPATLNAQEVKTEKKIMIIVDDGSGKKVIVDTLLNDDSDIKTIKTDDGKIVWISKSNDTVHINDQKGSKHITVTVTSDDEGHITEGENHVAVWTEKGETSDGDKVIVVKKTHGADSHLEKTYDVMVTTGEDESAVEKTRFVVAKDGMVITVEGEDEEKARELMKVIEDHLGVKENKEVKSESKKSSKK